MHVGCARKAQAICNLWSHSLVIRGHKRAVGSALLFRAFQASFPPAASAEVMAPSCRAFPTTSAFAITSGLPSVCVTFSWTSHSRHSPVSTERTSRSS